MSTYRSDYVAYRLSKAYESFEDARLLADNGSWNSSVNRLYYSCYYAVSALLLQKDVTTQPLIAPVGELLNTIKALIDPI